MPRDRKNPKKQGAPDLAKEHLFKLLTQKAYLESLARSKGNKDTCHYQHERTGTLQHVSAPLLRRRESRRVHLGLVGVVVHNAVFVVSRIHDGHLIEGSIYT